MMGKGKGKLIYRQAQAFLVFVMIACSLAWFRYRGKNFYRYGVCDGWRWLARIGEGLCAVHAAGCPVYGRAGLLRGAERVGLGFWCYADFFGYFYEFCVELA